MNRIPGPNRIAHRMLVLLAALALAAGAAGAQTPPKEDPEVKMGREAHEALLQSGIKLVGDPKLVERVGAIGKKLADLVNATPIEASYGTINKTRFEYRFFIVDDKDVNAFCLPGGYVYVNKGLLNYVHSDDELAGVLGHEILHAAHHHVLRLQKEQDRLTTQTAIGALAAIVARVPMTDTGNLLYGLQLVALQKISGYSQSAERDADRGGVILAQKGGYNPVGALTFMERLARDQRNRPDIEMGIFRTHPPEKERADSLVRQIEAMGLPINRRDTSNMLKVTVRPAQAAPSLAVGEAVTEVLLDGKVLYRSASPERARLTAQTLDRALNQPLQIYDITKRGAQVLARGQTVVTIEPDDAQALRASADALTDQAYRTLRNVLYRYVLEGAL